jgi:hypothetical protein
MTAWRRRAHTAADGCRGRPRFPLDVRGGRPYKLASITPTLIGGFMSEIHSSVVQLSKMLKNLDSWLDKAVAHAEKKKFDPSVYLEARLAPDMFPLTRQIQAACDGAKFLAARLSGKEAPKHPDTEKTLDELRARIRSVIEYLATFKASDFDGAEQRVIPLGFMPGKGLSASEWRLGFNLPNTYFHICMSYAILRHNGVELVKGDYIGALDIKSL